MVKHRAAVDDRAQRVHINLLGPWFSRLASEEGIFVGISAGATLAAALKAADTAKPGSVLLVMLPDTGERYLGTYLFDDLNAGSDDEWLASLDKK